MTKTQMWIGVVTIFPDLVRAFLRNGIIGKAIEQGHLTLEVFDLRDYATDSHRTVDDRPFGGGPGMVLMPGPLGKCVSAAQQRCPSKGCLTILLSPQGERFDQARAVELSTETSLLLIAGRYEGLDERFVDKYVDIELSIGDYVLTGGELPALIVIDTVARLLPGTLGNTDSKIVESFEDGLLDHPQYTRPRDFEGVGIPEVLVNGNHEEIARWRKKQSLQRTWLRRPDLLADHKWSKDDLAWYAGLPHRDGAQTEDEI